MNFNTNIEIGARFKLVVRKSSDNSISKETEWFHNPVLNSGLNRMSEGVWYRQQRDRYEIEYFVGEVPDELTLVQVGMNKKYRFQFKVY